MLFSRFREKFPSGLFGRLCESHKKAPQIFHRVAHYRTKKRKKKKIVKKVLTNRKTSAIIVERLVNGGIAQLARAFGSYPTGRWFKSDFRYQARWSSG